MAIFSTRETQRRRVQVQERGAKAASAASAFCSQVAERWTSSRTTREEPMEAVSKAFRSLAVRTPR